MLTSYGCVSFLCAWAGFPHFSRPTYAAATHRARSAPVKFISQQRGYVRVRIGDDMEALLDHVINACAIDFAERSEEAPGQRGVEVSERHLFPFLSSLSHRV
jgi:hypothetical protein